MNKNLTLKNFNTANGRSINYIVIHYTGNDGDTAYSNTNYFKNTYRGASAHYFVDEKEIWQCVEDKDVAWHCGTSGVYYHPYCRNANSIGVELCSYISSQGKYDFKPKTVDNTVGLVKQLMAKYKIPIQNVLRHYDVTHKQCPEPFVREAARWSEFKIMLTLSEEVYKVDNISIKVNNTSCHADRILHNNENFVKLRDFEKAGFEVGYDSVSKTPEIKNKPSELSIDIESQWSVESRTVGTINTGDKNYVDLRGLADALGVFKVDFINGKVVISI